MIIISNSIKEGLVQSFLDQRTIGAFAFEGPVPTNEQFQEALARRRASTGRISQTNLRAELSNLGCTLVNRGFNFPFNSGETSARNLGNKRAIIPFSQAAHNLKFVSEGPEKTVSFILVHIGDYNDSDLYQRMVSSTESLSSIFLLTVGEKDSGADLEFARTTIDSTNFMSLNDVVLSFN